MIEKEYELALPLRVGEAEKSSQSDCAPDLKIVWCLRRNRSFLSRNGAMAQQHTVETKQPIFSGDSVRHSKNNMTGTVISEENSETVVVQQDNGAIAPWAVSECEKVCGALIR